MTSSTAIERPFAGIRAGAAGTERQARRALTAIRGYALRLLRRAMEEELGVRTRESVSVAGPYFEEFERGQVFEDAPALTLTSGTPPSTRRSPAIGCACRSTPSSAGR